MIPKRSHKSIRYVGIHHNFGHIFGFSFCDKEETLLWKIGDVNPKFKVDIVVLLENEVIVGVNAKLSPGHQSFYTDL